MSENRQSTELGCAPAEEPADGAPTNQPQNAGRLLALYEQYAAAVMRYAAGLCGNPQMAMEATQQAFLELVQTNRNDGVEPWLFHRVKEILAERGAALPQTPRVALPDGDASTEVMAWAADQEVLARLRGRLTARELEILVMRLGGSSYTQISRSLDISIGTVASTLARAVKKARGLLKEDRG